MRRPFWRAVLLSFVCVVPLLAGCSGLALRATPTAEPLPGVVRIEDTFGRVGSLFLQGRWLVWHYYREAPTPNMPAVYGFAVYDLSAGQVIFTDAGSETINLIGDTLYLLKPSLSLSPSAYEASLFALDLSTREETVLIENVPYATRTNGQIAVWAEPQWCEPRTPCSPPAEYICGMPYKSRLYAYDLETEKIAALGEFGGSAYVQSMTEAVVYVGHRASACSIKSSTGPVIAVDLRAAELRGISPINITGPNDWMLTDVAGRRALLFAGANRSVVVDLPTGGDTQVVVNTEIGTAHALAGQDILVYAPNEFLPVMGGRHPGLAALNLQTGHGQQLSEGPQYVLQVVGDGQHVAWVTHGNELYLAEMNLQPRHGVTDGPSVLSTPNATLDARYISLQPSPVGTLSSWVAPTVPP